MAYAGIQGIIGLPPILFQGAPDTVQKFPLGMIADAVDPYWGGGEFIYLQMPLSQAIKVGGILSYDVATAFLAALMANTAILGKAAAICMNVVASSASAQYAWAMVSGQVPVWSGATVAANTAIGVTAAGQAGAVAAGKQLNNARVTLPATTTVAKTANTANGSPIITVASGDGWFPGVALSGTGIAASTVITSMSVDGKTITMNNNATADGRVTVTGTYNDATNFWNVVVCDRIGMQGPIT